MSISNHGGFGKFITPPVKAGGAAPQVVAVVGVGVRPPNSAYIEVNSFWATLVKAGWVIVN